LKSNDRDFVDIPEQIHPKRGLRTAPKFQFQHFITIAQPASPLKYLADLLLGFVRG
jgi:hypothetical protein